MSFNKIPKSEKIKPIIAIVSGIVIFSTIYLGAYYYNLDKLQDAKVSQDIKLEEAKGLDDKKLVIFEEVKSDGKTNPYYKLTIGEIKNTLGIDTIEEGELIKIFEEKGYKKQKSDETGIYFINAETTNDIYKKGLNPDKYYIGDKDGNIAIFKTDDKGNAFIEKEEDISIAKTNNYPSMDIEMIKGFTREFDTREECEDAIGDYIH